MAIDAGRAKSLFLAASDMPDAAERAAYLGRECGSDAELRDRVEALLGANDASPLPPAESGDATATHAVPLAAPGKGTYSPDRLPKTEDYSDPTSHVGAVIAGKYVLVERIGEGGMGSVWRAKQTDPVKRFVAVKLIKAGMDSKQVLARFEAERQALALMDHPNIAKVLDGGLHDHRPFFVMELVKGVPITEFCDARKFTPKQRLELFVPVCQAIQHAHQKGIIHRDIKPSNVLIALYDDKPVVKVIDFGVAKATGGALTERTIDTGFGGVVGTPQYMSPEQATFNNLDIDTRSDVYSLGVLLYELLTGTTPVDRKSLGQAALLEVLRIVREEEPPRPSTKLSTADALPTLSANRGTEPKKLTGLLRNELDWIVMKALEKDRARRYETANGFAADVLRYLSGEAVQAHPPSTAYRAKKFVRRNKVQVIAASLVLFALVGGSAGIVAVQSAANTRLSASLNRETRANAALAAANDDLTRSRVAVQARYDLAVEAIKTFHTGVSEDFLLRENQFKHLRDRLLNAAADFYGRLATLLGRETDFASRRALAQSNFELADLMAKIGRKQAALAAHRAVLAAREGLAAEPGADSGIKGDIGRSMTEVASLLRDTGKTDEALAAYRRAESLLAELTSADPAARAALAVCRARIALLLFHADQHAEALTALKLARADQQTPGTVPGASDDSRRELAETLNLIGFVLWGMGKPAEAVPELRAAMAIYQQLADDRRAVPEFRRGLASSHFYLGNVLWESGKPSEAEAELRLAIAMQQQVLKENPAVIRNRRTVAISRKYLGILLTATGRPEMAEAEYLAAIALLHDLADHDDGIADFRSLLAGVRIELGLLLLQLGKSAEAEAECRDSRAIMQELATNNPNVAQYGYQLAHSLSNLGEVLRSQGRAAEAKECYDRVLAVMIPLVHKNPTNLWSCLQMASATWRRGLALRDLGDPAGATADIRRALALCDGLEPLPVCLFETACCHATLAGLAGQPGSGVSAAEGEKAAERTMDWLRRAVALGYRNTNAIRIESAFDSLRGRADFQKMFAELDPKAQPSQELAPPPREKK